MSPPSGLTKQDPQIYNEVKTLNPSSSLVALSVDDPSTAHNTQDVPTSELYKYIAVLDLLPSAYDTFKDLGAVPKLKELH